MSTRSPNQQRGGMMKAGSTCSSTTSTMKTTTKTTTTTVNMAVAARTTKAKASKASSKANADGAAANSKQKTQMHRRSRTGCYTCRLRRKKCDEGSPLCTACKHLGLKCEYKRPLWWSNNEARRKQKDEIKMIIKRKKLSEKSSSQHENISTSVASVGSPPGLSHSLPTSATFTDPLDRTRSASIDSRFSFNFNSPPQAESDGGGAGGAGGPGSAGSNFSTPQMQPDFMFSSNGYPYDVDIKTERQLFVNDQPTLHESSISTYSTFQSPPPPGTVLPPYPCGVVPMDPTMTGGLVDGFVSPPLGSAGIMPMPISADGTPVIMGEAGGQWMEQVYSERHERLTEESLNGQYYGECSPQQEQQQQQQQQQYQQEPQQQPQPQQPQQQQQPQPQQEPSSATKTTTTSHVTIELDAGDQCLLDHFVQYVLPTVFPVLELNKTQLGSVGADLILPALQNNKCYLHCCLAVAAQHLKATLGTSQAADLDADIMRHRYATISAMCNALTQDQDHEKILEAALGMIFFQCCVGRMDNDLPDVSWHQHFQAVVSLVQRLYFPGMVSELQAAAATVKTEPSQETSVSSPGAPSSVPTAGPAPVPTPPQSQTMLPPMPTPFSMTVTAWIDIIGAAMQGRAPTFAHTYREKHLSPPEVTSLGLRELTGCEDRVLYLISEIACLEALKAGGMDDITLCQHVSVLGDQIGLTELGETPAKLPFTASGGLDPSQLSKNMTAAFRLAARVYLCSLVPGFHPAQPSCIGLVDKLTAVLRTIPCGLAGFDRSVAWVYLMAGAASTPTSEFRGLFAERVEQLGELSREGSFGRVVALLSEVWHQESLLLQEQSQQAAQAQAQASASSSPVPGGAPAIPSPTGLESPSTQQYIHWRDVMVMKGWDFVLI